MKKNIFMEFPAINPQNKEDLQDLHKAMEK